MRSFNYSEEDICQKMAIPELGLNKLGLDFRLKSTFKVFKPLKVKRTVCLIMNVMKVDGPAGFWIFCKSYLEPKSSKVLVISFEHL